MLFHKDCGGKLVLDLSEMFTLVSPGISITTKGISPGVAEIRPAQKRAKIILLCTSCNERFTTKDDFENKVVVTCGFCNESLPPSKIHVLEYGPFVCTQCKSGENKKSDEFSSMYKEMMQKDTVVLLTLLLKK